MKPEFKLLHCVYGHSMGCRSMGCISCRATLMPAAGAMGGTGAGCNSFLPHCCCLMSAVEVAPDHHWHSCCGFVSVGHRANRTALAIVQVYWLFCHHANCTDANLDKHVKATHLAGDMPHAEVPHAGAILTLPAGTLCGCTSLWQVHEGAPCNGITSSFACRTWAQSGSCNSLLMLVQHHTLLMQGIVVSPPCLLCYATPHNKSMFKPTNSTV